MYFHVYFSPNNSESHMVGGPWTDKQVVASKLQEMGFTESLSQMVADWIAKQPVSGHQSLLSRVERYVENVFNYDIFLNEYGNSYPYQDSKVNKWFHVPVKVSRRGEVMKTVDVPFFNTTLDKARGVINKKATVDEKFGLECWFHGTVHNSAKDIVEQGIDLKKGKKKLDFSHGDGFYLSPDGSQAVEWVESEEHGAVIIFKASAEMRNECHLLDLRSNPENWTTVVKWNRSGENKRERLVGHLSDAYENCHYIRGPMAGDNTEYHENWEPIPKKSNQICLKKDVMARRIDKNILGVVCWNK